MKVQDIDQFLKELRITYHNVLNTQYDYIYWRTKLFLEKYSKKAWLEKIDHKTLVAAIVLGKTGLRISCPLIRFLVFGKFEGEGKETTVKTLASYGLLEPTEAGSKCRMYRLSDKYSDFLDKGTSELRKLLSKE